MPVQQHFCVLVLRRICLVLVLRAVCVGLSDIEGCDRVLLFKLSVKPDENPEQDRDCNCADQTAGKEPLPAWKRKNCAEERDEIERY